MKSQFYKGTTKSQRIWMPGLCIAVTGFLVGMIGYWIGVTIVALIGFFAFIVGFAMTFVGMSREVVIRLLGKPDPKL